MKNVEATSSKVAKIVFTMFVALMVIALLIQVRYLMAQSNQLVDTYVANLKGFDQLASSVTSVFGTVGLLF